VVTEPAVDEEFEIEDEAEAEEAERAVLRIVRAERPGTLIELRTALEPLSIETTLLEATVWSLINQRTIVLNPDRTLSITE
jgi:hypothetical protein